MATLQASARNCVLACLALAALVFSSRLWLIDSWGSPVPFWDQWDAEALQLYIPWLEGTFDWHVLFAGHNEHRIVFTRATTLAMFVLQDDWNLWTELTFNAILHASIAVGFLAMFWRVFTPMQRAGFIMGLAVFFSAPFGWENALWGFQSQFYFSTLFALVAFSGLFLRPFNTPGWWLGVLASLAALGTHGGGVMVAASAIAAVATDIPARRLSRQDWISLGLLLAILALGVLLRVDAPHHRQYHARSLDEFINLFVKCLAWPHRDGAVIAIVLQAPVCVLVIRRWIRRQPLNPIEKTMVALMTLSILSAAALAYSRGHALPGGPLPRHQDVMIPGLIAQIAAALSIAARHNRPGRIAFFGWIACLSMGGIARAEINFTQNLPYKRVQDQASLEMVRLYNRTHQPEMLKPRGPWRSPHPSHYPSVAKVLDNASLRPRLPVELNAPPGTPVIKPSFFRQGRWLTLISGALLALWMLTMLRSTRRAAA